MSRRKLHASAVGTVIGPVQNVVTSRRVMAYAAAIGATGQHYFERHCAPPSFVVALEWPLVNGASYRAALGASVAVMEASLHVTQDSAFLRPIRAGDVLKTTALIAAMRETSAGVLTTTRLDTIAASGALVATSWYSTIALDTILDGVSAACEQPPELPALQPILNPILTTIPIARSMPHIYSECSGIWNPIHTDIDAARRAGLDDIILHGTCSWALAGNQIVESYCDGDPTRLRRLAARFQGRVVPGTTVDLKTWFDGTAAGFIMTNDRAEPVQRGGFATISLNA